ncbi:MAG: hypothetical protein K0V04_00260 [Deltaproteobacteria bacterium]|nr:hypothetical protein [Deltaproteobacteria bacterium]
MDLPAKPRAPGPLSLAELQGRIKRRIREFDPTALLDLLASIGYEPEQIGFRGHLSASPQPSIIHDIELLGRPGGEGSEAEPSGPRVMITVNLGLVSCRSPLPSYLLGLCHDLDVRDPVRELLDMLDRSLLHTRLTADRPARILSSWGDVRLDFLRIHGLDSPMGLRWLFAHVFPELSVRVHRVTDDYRVPFDAARLSFSALGRCAFGDTSRLTVQDIEVTLTTHEALYWGQPWATVAQGRVRRHVLPLLTEVCMNLTVVMLRVGDGSYAYLSEDRPPQPASYMGYDPMVGASSDRDDLPPVRMVLYRGALPLTEPGTEELEQVLVAGHLAHLELTKPEQSQPPSLRTGSTVALSLRYRTKDGHRYDYDVEVRWGARAWYVDEPFEMSLVHAGVPQDPPDPSRHPNLWLRLRDEARTSVADRLAHAAMVDTVLGEAVSLELIEGLIERGDPGALHALSWSRMRPAWDADAWQRFLRWSDG